MLIPASLPAFPPAIISAADVVGPLPCNCVHIYIAETYPEENEANGFDCEADLAEYEFDEDVSDEPTGVSSSLLSMNIILTSPDNWQNNKVSGLYDPSADDDREAELGLDKSGWFASPNNPNDFGSFFNR